MGYERCWESVEKGGLGFGGKVKSGVERFGLEGGFGAKKGAETRENEEDGKKKGRR